MSRAKKTISVCFVVLALAICLPGYARAAAVPVYLEGEYIAEAVEQGGYTYLPMRTLFENIGAAVTWDEENQMITAALANGWTMQLWVGSTTAHIEKQGRGYDFNMEVPPYVSQGVVYVPLRSLVGDMLSFGVLWQNNGVQLSFPSLSLTDTGNGETYTLNLYNGEFWLYTAFDESRKLLGSCPPPYAVYEQSRVTGDLRLVWTQNGNYLLTAEGYAQGAQEYSLRWFAYVDATTADGDQSCGDYALALNEDSLPPVWQKQGQLWFSGLNGVHCVDETSYQNTVYNGSQLMQEILGRPYATAYAWWSDGGRLLLGDMDCFVLYDINRRQGVDLTPLLLNDELKKQVEDKLGIASYHAYQQQDDYSDFWQEVGNTSAMLLANDVGWLSFAGAEDELLHFNFYCRYFDPALADEPVNYQVEVYPLTINLAEIIL